MKLMYGTAGVLLLLFGADLPLPEQGVVMAVLFLGACLCLGALALMVHPLLERLAVQHDIVHYVKQHELHEINNQRLQITLDKDNVEET